MQYTDTHSIVQGPGTSTLQREIKRSISGPGNRESPRQPGVDTPAFQSRQSNWIGRSMTRINTVCLCWTSNVMANVSNVSIAVGDTFASFD